MNIKTEINTRIDKVVASNASRLKNYKAKLFNQIKINIKNKGQTAKDNKVLADRYYNAIPAPLTQMQLALQKAAA